MAAEVMVMPLLFLETSSPSRCSRRGLLPFCGSTLCKTGYGSGRCLTCVDVRGDANVAGVQ